MIDTSLLQQHSQDHMAPVTDCTILPAQTRLYFNAPLRLLEAFVCMLHALNIY